MVYSVLHLNSTLLVSLLFHCDRLFHLCNWHHKISIVLQTSLSSTHWLLWLPQYQKDTKTFGEDLSKGVAVDAI